MEQRNNGLNAGKYAALRVRDLTLADRVKRAIGGIPTLVLDVRSLDVQRRERVRAASIEECRRILGH